MPYSRWFTRRASIGVLVLAAGGLVVASTSSAIADVNTNFELDGNVAQDGTSPPPDWQSLFTTGDTTAPYTTVATQAASLPSGFASSNFFRDFTPGSTADNSTYATGSKDTLPITPGWQCKKSNNVTDKGDIQNTYMTPYRAANGHLIIYAGLEKNSSNGDNNMAVWLLQDNTIACTAGSGNTPFSGSHENGDVLLVAAFLSGGTNPIITGYEWENGAVVPIPGGVGGKCGATATNLCAITNSAQITTPWVTDDKVLGTGFTLGADQFYEMGADLTALGVGNCFASYLADTRSSQSLGATLYDYALGSASTCGSTTMQDTAATASPSTIRSGGSVTLTFYEKNDGSVTLGSPHVTTDDGTCANITTPSLDASNNIIGDSNTNGKFDPGETWQFSCLTSDISSVGTDTIHAFGHGLDPGGADVTFCAVTAGHPPNNTYPCNANETTSVSVTVIAPGTELTETASAAITYTFNEKNTGTSAPLSNPSVTAGSGQCDSAPAQSLKADAVHNVGDTDNNGVLDPGETWVWTCTHTLSGPTADTGSSSETNVGTGNGTDATNSSVTYPGTPKERDSVTVTITNNARCTSSGNPAPSVCS